ncbi:MAG: rod shape-determining protein RodA [Gammaproteobacteria bacterium]|nr:rod shape-determining protein RodA [Gammaproteobacteria bacterium]
MRSLPYRFRSHLDSLLSIYLSILLILGLTILTSASQQNWDFIRRQILNIVLGVFFMVSAAQFPPRFYNRFAPLIFGVSCGLLLLVMGIGDVGKGAQRWLEISFLRFQPTELVKITVPLMIAWYLNHKPLPPSPKDVMVIFVSLLMMTALVVKQPDLGSAIMIMSVGIAALFLSGIRWKFFVGGGMGALASFPLLWMFMHDYQKKRVLTFLNPNTDPLGSGWNIIQSKIAIGSGGVFGKGWLNGTQSHLGFLPERSTDFIFAVLSEEFGLVGVATLLVLYSLIILRGFQIAIQAQDTFSRLFAGSFTMAFALYVIINIGMVSGLLPVVGLPLPFLSYGGTALVTLMTGFGILMSIASHRRILAM